METMKLRTCEMRICTSCGLRYPLIKDGNAGFRCPACLGDTILDNSHAMCRDQDRKEVDRKPTNFRILLDNIRSGFNVGSILRTAEGFGVEHAYLCGITPNPEERAVQKTELGASSQIHWSHHRNAVELATKLKSEGWVILGLETEATAAPISQITISAPHVGAAGFVLTVGNEIAGIDPALLHLCTGVYCIPLKGSKHSINVAVAFGIAAYLLASIHQHPVSGNA